ncbi:MAG: DUF2891 family protein, partial [Gemmatimonadaceae bacterium]
MKFIVAIAVLTLALGTSARAQQSAAKLDAPTAGQFAALALACVQREYPNKIAHVLNSPEDVNNLSRAWMLEGIAAGLPSGDHRIRALMAAADTHAASGLATVTGEHYAGGHWLGSFATYLITRRGVG